MTEAQRKALEAARACSNFAEGARAYVAALKGAA